MADVLHNLPLTALPPAGHYGAAGSGVRIRVLDGLSLASVSAARGCTGAVIDACHTAFGIVLFDQPRVSDGGAVSFVGSGPGRWLALSASKPSLARTLTDALGADAAICDQSDAYVVLALDGPAAPACLAKGPAVDFDLAVFGSGAAATTTTGHIGVTIWRPDEAAAYRLAIARSFAPSFVRMLLQNAAEFGIDFA